MPKACPSCGSPIVREKGEAAYRCVSIDCPAQAHERLTHWASRGALDIEGMGNEIVARLIESGNLTDVADYTIFRRIRWSIWILAGPPPRASGFELGPVVASKLMLSINESKKRSLARVLFGLGIRHVGKTTAEAIAKVYPSMNLLRGAKVDDLAAIDGVGSIIAQSIF